MDILNTEINAMVSKVTLTLTPEDYKDKFEKELNNHGKKVQLKGFRKGKSSKGMIRKLYGRSILAEVINHEVQHAMGHYLEDQGMQILGQPIPSEDQKTFEFDPMSLESFEFSFDVAKQPEINLDHVADSTKFTRYVIEVTDEDVTRELDYIRNSMGKQIEPEDVQEDDIVYFIAREKDEQGLKAGGYETKFSVMVKVLADDVKKQIQGRKVGERISFDIFELEPDRAEESVKKYFLNLEEGDEREMGRIFEGEIEQISRRVPAEMDEAFFKQAFGEEVNNEEEARNFLQGRIRERLAQDADALLFRDFQDYLLAKTNVELPDDFLKRLLKMQNENVSEEEVEKDYDKFAENFRWQLIEEKLSKSNELEVTSEEIVRHLTERVSGYFGQYGYMGDMSDMIHQTVMRLVKDEEQVRRAGAEIMTDKVMQALKGQFGVDDKEVSRDRFKELVEQKAEDRQASLFA